MGVKHQASRTMAGVMLYFSAVKNDGGYIFMAVEKQMLDLYFRSTY